MKNLSSFNYLEILTLNKIVIFIEKDSQFDNG